MPLTAGMAATAGMGITRMGAMALMAARPRRDAMVAPAERSLTRPENFIFQAQKSRAIRAGRIP
ncbi:hypothetical protein FMJ35_03310 [Klebsiella michiganensis]|nr:hypothetical protein [Klebsiella michiganensis]